MLSNLAQNIKIVKSLKFSVKAGPIYKMLKCYYSIITETADYFRLELVPKEFVGEHLENVELEDQDGEGR
jgi:hypothetical protein